MFEICSDLFKTVLKIYYFRRHLKKAKKWPNGQTIIFLANSLKKAKWQPWLTRHEETKRVLHRQSFVVAEV